MIKVLRNILGDALGSFGIGNGYFRPHPAYPYTFKQMDYEWKIGYEWYLKRIEGQVVLDGGCLEHLEFDKILCQLGFKVYGVDIGAKPEYSHDNFNFIQKHIWETDIEPNSIDCIIANSLLEHLGLPYYNQRKVENADKLTVSEFDRILTPGGLLLIQVPFGETNHMILKGTQPFYRVYTSKSLAVLLESFKIESQSYFIYECGGWIEVNELIAGKVKVNTGLPPCLCYVKARKHG